MSEPVRVMLRTSKDEIDDLFVLFPEVPATAEGDGLCACYCLQGKHMSANLHLCKEDSRQAEGDDAQRLLDALKDAGYDNLEVVKRCTKEMHERRGRNDRCPAERP